MVTDANVSPTRIGRDDCIYRPGDSFETEHDYERLAVGRCALLS